MTERRSRRTGPAARCGWVALVLTLAAGACTGSGPDAGPASSAAPVVSTSPERLGVASWNGLEVRVGGARAAAELQGAEGAGSLQPESGQVFIVVDVSFTVVDGDPGEVAVSSADGTLVPEGGSGRPAVGSGGEDGYCVECTVDVSTSDESFEFSFVFALDRDQATAPLSFQFRDLTPLPFAVGPLPDPVASTPSPAGTPLELKPVASSPYGGEGLGRDFANSDLAFWEDLAVAGSYDGFRLIDISDPLDPTVLSTVACRTRQGDVSVWDDLVFLSNDMPTTDEGCDGIDTAAANDQAFEGIRVFDISDRSAPRLVASVPTDCGSHTHTLLPDERRDRVLLYVSSYAGTEESLGPSCRNPFARISVVEVPLERPDEARVVAEPALPDTPVHQWPEPPPGIPTFIDSAGCHDIQVFAELRLAAAACMSEGQLWDLTDPLRPTVLAHVDVPEVEFWHSAAFTWDGEIVVFGDEAFFAGPGCHDPDRGALWFFSVSDPSRPLGHFPVPREQGDAFPCSYHEFDVVPVPDRYLLVAGAYAAGVSVVDFTDPSLPGEVAFADLAGMAPSNTWTAYWYDGSVYASDLGERGIDVFELPEELVAWASRLGRLNPQTQESVLP
jgi:hypothetical protein